MCPSRWDVPISAPLGACDRVLAVVLAYEAGVVTPDGRTAVVERPPADPAT